MTEEQKTELLKEAKIDYIDFSRAARRFLNENNIHTLYDLVNRQWDGILNQKFMRKYVAMEIHTAIHDLDLNFIDEERNINNSDRLIRFVEEQRRFETSMEEERKIISERTELIRQYQALKELSNQLIQEDPNLKKELNKQSTILKHTEQEYKDKLKSIRARRN